MRTLEANHLLTNLVKIYYLSTKKFDRSTKLYNSAKFLNYILTKL